jgi:CPA1 family monovalent cation:H+ antiporter
MSSILRTSRSSPLSIALDHRPRSKRQNDAMVEICEHLEHAPKPEGTPAESCPDCIKEGLNWVALRRCLTCGNVGCCDSSPGRHATRHFEETQHPVMQAASATQAWRWCYIHKING